MNRRVSVVPTFGIVLPTPEKVGWKIYNIWYKRAKVHHTAHDILIIQRPEPTLKPHRETVVGKRAGIYSTGKYESEEVRFISVRCRH